MSPTRRGTSRAYALERLQKKAPDLHAQVVARKMSAHAAMVQAGLEKGRFTVVVSSADAIARTLRRQLPPDMLAEVVAELSK